MTMKKIIFILLAGTFLVMTGISFGQKITSGDFKVLNGQSVVSLQYDYSKMKIGKFDNEADYVKSATAERNKKKAGSGDEWAAKWASDKADRYQPTFQKEFNNIGGKCGITGKQDFPEAKYTLIIRTLFLEPGVQTGTFGSKPAYLNLTIDLVETANPGTILATIDYPKVQSVNMGGFDYDTGERIRSAYDRAGGNIGALICKSMIK